jgi:hypothetical protein
MLAIVETDATFHLPMSALKAGAPERVEAIVRTDATFHLPMSAVKEDAPESMEAIVETDATFHLPMSALNGVLANTSRMLETQLTSHSAIGP